MATKTHTHTHTDTHSLLCRLNSGGQLAAAGLHTKTHNQQVQEPNKTTRIKVHQCSLLQKEVGTMAAEWQGGSNPASAARPMPCAHATLRTKGHAARGVVESQAKTGHGTDCIMAV